MKSKAVISIVVPLYNEADNVVEFYRSLTDVAATIQYDLKIIFVDDGSTDSTATQITALDKTAVDYKLVRLSRNFGKEAAVSAGLAQADGAATIIIDADMQHPIEKIPEFITAWEQGADVVVGVRNGAGDGRWFKRLTSALFYRFIKAVSTTTIIPHETDYRLLTREVIDQYNALTEHNRITRGLIDWLGYDRAVVYFDAKKRTHGTPKYSYRKLTRLAINTFVSHSFFPLRFAGYIGIFIVLISGLLGGFVLIEDIIMKDPLGLNTTGTGMLALVILFLVGVILSCLGLFGLYIASIQDEVANRPLYIVRKNNKV
jgi:polyisoprenyl-phosphate glycosyltransferase